MDDYSTFRCESGTVLNENITPNPDLLITAVECAKQTAEHQLVFGCHKQNLKIIANHIIYTMLSFREARK